MIREGSNQAVVDNSIERLRVLLQSEQKRTIEYSEAEDVANAFFVFFEALASEDGSDQA